MPKKDEFKGKVVLVTGGSMGIGEGCARSFVHAGAMVVICARNAKTGEATAKTLSAEGPGKCEFLACDVSDPEAIRKMIDAIAKKYGRLDCVVNNAGVHPPDVLIDDISIEDFKSLLQINLVSIFAACKYALPHLRKVKGSIINMSSLVGTIGQVHASSYVATKGGITALTKALAIDEAPNGVRVNAIEPGVIMTPLSDGLLNKMPKAQKEEFAGRLARWQQIPRWGQIEECGEACLFLASEGASFITGVALPVSAGAELGYGVKATSNN